MADIYVNHDDTWTASTIAAAAITSGTASDGANSATSEVISLDGFDGVIISVQVAYGATINEGVKVYVLSDIDGTLFEAVADGAWGFEMPRTASTTHRRSFSISAEDYATLKVRVANNSGATVTVTVRYKRFKRTTA